MKRLVGTGLALLLAAGTASAQYRAEFYSNPDPPPRAVLDRLNLVQGWRTYIPTRGRGDGLGTVQLAGKDLLVQTRSGIVCRLDAETGITYWRTQVGSAYADVRPLAYNSRSVYVINSSYLFALSRETGKLRWQFRLKSGASAAPVADENFILISSPDARLTSYYLPGQGFTTAPAAAPAPSPTPERKPGEQKSAPDKMISPEEQKGPVRLERDDRYTLYEIGRKSTGTISHLTTVREAGEVPPTGPQPFRVWQAATNGSSEWTPLQTPEEVLVVSPEGTATDYAKKPRESGSVAELFRLPLHTTVPVQPGQFGQVAYIPGADANLYALDMRQGRVRWRHIAGDPILAAPQTTEEDVYVSTRGSGLARLDRATGEPVWRVPRGNRVLTSNPDASRFLAANPKFVYALDRSGRLVVLDRRRGKLLSSYNVRDFVVPVPNQETDRLYLAANNGLVVCLHDREYKEPILHRRSEDRAANILRSRLAQKVTEPAGKAMTLRAFVEALQKKYGLKVVIGEALFKLAGVEDVDKKPVTPPQVTDELLSEWLTRVLDQVNARYRIVEDTILIEPKPKGGKPE